MKLARYLHNGAALLGTVSHDAVRSLPRAVGVLDVLGLPVAERNRLELQAGRHHRVPVERAQFLAPLDPPAVRDVVTGQDGGAADRLLDLSSVFGPSDEVPVPAGASYRFGVAAVVGSPAPDRTAEPTGGPIVGYTLIAEWSAGDLPDGGTRIVLGPWITTPDELAEHDVDGGYDLGASVAVNGVELAGGTVADPVWSVEDVLARAAELPPGDVLGMGLRAVQGLPRLRAGDVVAVTVAGLGTLTQRIGA